MLAKIGNVRHLVQYTSFQALAGIVRNNELWFSPVMGMNDWGEIERGKRLLESLSQGSTSLSACFSRVRAACGFHWKKLEDAYNDRRVLDQLHTFVSCWSECDLANKTHDDLAMWRGYGGDGNGVAIVIDPFSFAIGAGVRSDIVAWPVFYETEAVFELRACAAFNAFADSVLELQPVEMEEFCGVVAHCFSELCFFLSVTHKHPGFAAEKEWRFVWRRHFDDSRLIHRVKAQITPRGLLEYFCFHIDDLVKVATKAPTLQEIIKAVMIGPTVDAHLKQHAVATLLHTANFDHQATVTQLSEIPYRSFR